MCVDTEYRWENCTAVEIHHLVCISHINHTRLQIDDKPCPNFRVEQVNYTNTPNVKICQCKLFKGECIRNTNGLPGDKNEHWEFEHDESGGSWPNYYAKGKEIGTAAEEKGKNVEGSPIKNPSKRRKGLTKDDEDMTMDAGPSGSGSGLGPGFGSALDSGFGSGSGSGSGSASIKREVVKSEEELDDDLKDILDYYTGGEEMQGIR